MTVPMVRVGGVRVLVGDRFVPMAMGVRLAHGPVVDMLVMLVVNVQMLMLERIVTMQVRVASAQEQHHTRRHQRCGDQVENARPVAEKRNGEKRSGEGRRGKEGRLPRCP